MSVGEFPAGLSRDYMGGLPRPNGKYAYPADKLSLEMIQAALHLNGFPMLWRKLEVFTRSLIWSTKCFYKYGVPNSVRGPGFFQKAFDRWSDEIITPLTQWEFLPPPVKEAFEKRPVCRRTGDELWDQRARGYWYMLDNLAQKLAKHEREKNCQQFQKEYDFGRLHREDWRC